MYLISHTFNSSNLNLAVIKECKTSSSGHLLQIYYCFTCSLSGLYKFIISISGIRKLEHKENSYLLVNCTAVIFENYPVFWKICINDLKILCRRGAIQRDCTEIDEDFKGRVRYVDPGTIKLLNMQKDESGIVSCYASKPTPTSKTLYKTLFIGKILNDLSIESLIFYSNVIKNKETYI